MLEFYKTRPGKKFIDKDLPDLIKALNGVANSINENNKLEKKRQILEKKKLGFSDDTDDIIENTKEKLSEQKDKIIKESEPKTKK